MNAFFNLEHACQGDRALQSQTVAVVYGGTSSEAEVSFITGHSVLEALQETSSAGHGPQRVIGIELDREERWKLVGQPGGATEFLASLSEVDICFLALHGGDGEDGHVQGLLAAAGKAFTGSSMYAASASMDKWVSRLVAAQAGLQLADGLVVDRALWNAEEEHTFLALLERSPAGVCVKPRRGGSSVGVTRSKTVDETRDAALTILETGDEVLIESWTEGIEVACGVLGNRDGDPRALMPVEIRPHDGRFFDYEEKYSETGAEEFCPPESLGAETCNRIRERALSIHRALGCDGYSRSDFIIPHAREAASDPVFLELNSLPGLTPRSLLPLAAAEAGLDFGALCLGILAAGLQREELRR